MPSARRRVSPSPLRSIDSGAAGPVAIAQRVGERDRASLVGVADRQFLDAERKQAVSDR